MRSRAAPAEGVSVPSTVPVPAPASASSRITTPPPSSAAAARRTLPHPTQRRPPGTTPTAQNRTFVPMKRYSWRSAPCTPAPCRQSRASRPCRSLVQPAGTPGCRPFREPALLVAPYQSGQDHQPVTSQNRSLSPAALKPHPPRTKPHLPSIRSFSRPGSAHRRAPARTAGRHHRLQRAEHQ